MIQGLKISLNTKKIIDLYHLVTRKTQKCSHMYTLKIGPMYSYYTMFTLTLSTVIFILSMYKNIFGMATMPLLCKSTLLFQRNLPKVLPVTIYKYVSCLIPYIVLFLFLCGEWSSLALKDFQKYCMYS